MIGRYPIVLVHCKDQTYHLGSIDDRDAKELDLSEMVAVGHLVHEDEKKVSVALECFNDHDVRYTVTIPKKMVIKMETLREQSKD